MTGRFENVLAAAGLAALLTACGGARAVTHRRELPNAEPVAGAEVDSAALPALSAARSGDQRILPRDLIDVAVFDAPDLSRIARVSDDGTLSLPLLGPVKAVGRTPRELEVALQDTLRATYMRDPRVSVTIKEQAPRPVYVVGEVNQPGAYTASGEEQLTVLRAVAVARGAKPSAAQGRAVVLRPQPGGEPLQIPVNLNEMVKGKIPDLALNPNDVVYLPKNGQRAIVLGFVDALVRVVTIRRTF